jgi:hypothetical protein
MKNSTFYLLTFISTWYANFLICCPQGFSSNDQRPFFEQYDQKNNPVEKQEKEE